jgi:hypothetical protein
MLSVSICPKVITLSCFYCSVLYFGLNSHHLYIESLKIYLITVKIELILERMSTLPGCIFHQILWPGVLHCHRCKRLAHLLRVRRKSFRRKSEQKNDLDVSENFYISGEFCWVFFNFETITYISTSNHQFQYNHKISPKPQQEQKKYELSNSNRNWIKWEVTSVLLFGSNNLCHSRFPMIWTSVACNSWSTTIESWFKFIQIHFICELRQH